jgi:hypothetical protein
MINSTEAAGRLSRLLTYGSGSLTSRDFADLAIVLEELRELRGCHWEEWGVQLVFGGGTTTVEHRSHHEAQRHLALLLDESPQRAFSVDLVRRVHAQGNWIAMEPTDE